MVFLMSGRFLEFCFYASIFLAFCVALIFGIAKVTGHTGTIKTFDKDGNVTKEQRY